MSGAGSKGGWAGVHVIADGGPADPARAIAIVEAALEGGARIVQVRLKGATSRALFHAAEEAVARARRVPGAKLVVNDRLDVALAAGADAVHLGREDLAPEDARRALAAAGSALEFGLSTHDLAQARAAEAAGAAYIGFGPIFATGSKADALAPRGLGQLGEVRRAVGIPVIAIGGITIENAESVIRAGASGIAVISAVAASVDPLAAVRALVALCPAKP